MDEAGGGGLSPEAAFALLGEEMRLSILFAIYEATQSDDPGRRSVPYSELQRAVDEPDSGRFNYHLSRLTDHFVEQVEGGYAMRQAGKSVVRAVLSGTFTDDPRFGPVAVEVTCFRCGGQVAVSYANEHVFTQCRECEGSVGFSDAPPGTLSGLPYPPAGLSDRTPTEILELAHGRFEHEVGMLAAGTCPECGGAASLELEVCADHGPGETTRCPRCDLSIGAVVDLHCLTCGFDRVSPPLLAHTRNPRVLEVLNVDGPETGAWTRFGVAMTRPFDVVDPGEPSVAYPDASGEHDLHVAGDLSLSVV